MKVNKMKTRTFNTPKELMIALLQGEKWVIKDKFNYCYYQDKHIDEYPFWVSMKNTDDYELQYVFPYCDGKTIWYKVEEKTELDLMKEKYASGDYIIICKTRIQ